MAREGVREEDGKEMEWKGWKGRPGELSVLEGIRIGKKRE